MSAWANLGAGGRAVTLLLGGAIVAGIGYIALRQQAAPPPAPLVSAVADAPDAPSAAAPDAAPVAASSVPDAAAAPDPAAEAAPLAPSFDSWRVAADGAAVVAGRAAPGAVVSVLVDGVAVAQATADAAGSFAMLFTLAPTDKPGLMTLEAALADAPPVPGAQTVALEPIAGPPVAVAAAEPEAQPAAEPAAEPAAAPPAAIMVTDAGATVVQPGAAPDATTDTAVAANVSVDAITYTPAGDVQLGGRGQAGQFVRVYLDDAARLTALVPEGGAWLATLPPTEPGVYTLRVDQIDAGGAVTSRFETPFKRETLEALAAAAAPAAAAPEAAPAADPGPAPVAVAAADPQPAPEPAQAPQTEPAPAPASEPAPLPAAPAVTEPAAPSPATDEGATVQAPAAAPAAPGAAEPAPAAAQSVTITVQPGFTLWGIARQQMGEGVMYVQVYEANKDKIRNPDLIYPGQVFTLPIGN